MDQKAYIRSKIYTLPQLQKQVHIWRFKSNKVVFTNGCFDLLHQGHIEVLTAARNLGHKLIVGLNTDLSVKQLKGPTRPIQNEDTRAMVLASLAYVDAVVLFSDETPAELINTLIPDVLVKGGDYKKEDIVGYDAVTNNGGEVVVIDILPGHSTTNTEQQLKGDSK